MAKLTGKELADGIRQRVDELKKVCRGVDESTAFRAPAGDGRPRRSFPTSGDLTATDHCRSSSSNLSGETPTLDIDPGNPFFSESRSRMSFSALLAEVEKVL